jgi:hypothetical protein
MTIPVSRLMAEAPGTEALRLPARPRRDRRARGGRAGGELHGLPLAR